MKSEGVRIKTDGEDRLLDDFEGLLVCGGEGEEMLEVLDRMSSPHRFQRERNALQSSDPGGPHSVCQQERPLRQLVCAALHLGLRFSSTARWYRQRVIVDSHRKLQSRKSNR